MKENPQMFLHVTAKDSFRLVASANKSSLDLVWFHALKKIKKGEKKAVTKQKQAMLLLQ